MGRGRDTIRKRDDVEEQFVSSLRFSLSLSLSFLSQAAGIDFRVSPRAAACAKATLVG